MFLAVSWSVSASVLSTLGFNLDASKDQYRRIIAPYVSVPCHFAKCRQSSLRVVAVDRNGCLCIRQAPPSVECLSDQIPSGPLSVLRLILRRLAAAAPGIIGVVVVTFLLNRALPGDPAAFFAGPAATFEHFHADKRSS